MKGWLILLCLCCCLGCFAQGKYDANWCFGKGAGIDFNQQPPTVFQTKCDNVEASGSISDSFGNCLLYLADPGTNCINNNPSCYSYYDILDNTGAIITNGDSLKADYSITNGILILPVRAFATEYYILHIQIDDSSGKSLLYYSTVNVINGQPKISRKNVLLLSGGVGERLAATRTADGKGWWILLHVTPGDDTLCTNKFILYQLTFKEGFKFINTQNLGSKFCGYEAGEMTFNKNGTKLVNCNFDSSSIDIFDFDRCSGMLSNSSCIKFPGHRDPYGCEFSQNGYIYISTGIVTKKNTIYQVEIDSVNHPVNLNVVFNDSTSNMYFGQLQIAPNGKIYLSSLYGSYPFDSSQNRYLSVINHPDSLGVACDFQPFSFYLGDSTKSYVSLPNFPNYNLGPLSTIWETGAGNDTSICANQDSIVKGVPLGGDSIAGVTATWQAAPGIDNIHQLYQVVYPTQSQWYYVTLTDTTIVGSCQSRLDSVYVQVVNCDTTGVGEATTSGIRIYPNPAHDQLVVECHLSDTRQQKPDNRFVMYDIMGQIVLSKQLTGNKTLLDVSTLPQGLYLYRIGAVVGKVQVVR